MVFFVVVIVGIYILYHVGKWVIQGVYHILKGDIEVVMLDRVPRPFWDIFKGEESDEEYYHRLEKELAKFGVRPDIEKIKERERLRRQLRWGDA